MGGIDVPAGPRPNWFIALPVPPQPGWIPSLDLLPPELRRFVPQDRHLTLAFLGACGKERARRAWAALAPLRHGSIGVRPDSWRAMGPARRPSAYALQVSEGGPALAELIRLWGDRARRGAGLPPEDRVPLPHITVARPPRRRAEALQLPMRRWMRTAPVPRGPFLLRRIALYGWSPDRMDRLFRIVAHRRLDAAESTVKTCIGHPGVPDAPHG